MGWLKKVTDFVMPITEEEEFVEELESVKATEPVTERVEERKVANGGTVTYGETGYGSVPIGGMTSFPGAAGRVTNETSQSVRPQLTVHKSKPMELTVRLYKPTNFDQVTEVADDIKAKRAAIINYEKVDLAEQRRICDFVNGVCYVTNGDAKRISGNIVLYVPDGVDAEEALAMVK